MNSPDLDILTRLDRTALRADAVAICADAELGVSVTYRQRGTPTRDFQTGAVTEQFTSNTVRAVKAPADVDLGTGVQIGDVDFIIPASSLSAIGVTPGASDEIVVGTTVHQVLRAAVDPAGILWKFRCRREGI